MKMVLQGAFVFCVLVFASSIGRSSADADVVRLGRVAATTKLPKPLSDVSASLGKDGRIYIAGGCDSPLGNQYNEELATFTCESVSSSFYAFDPEIERFTVLPAMPSARYRHAAVAINNQIWLVGGRDENDNVVGEVHVSHLLAGTLLYSLFLVL